MKCLFYYETPIGTLGIGEENGAICRILFPHEKPTPDYGIRETSVLKQMNRELSEYFAGKRKKFTMPLVLHGTEFQIAEWKLLQNIPYAQTSTYSDMAIRIGNPKACRAVGAANGKNPIPIVIPCHRVIGANGTLTGYAGGLSTKKYLLELEKEND